MFEEEKIYEFSMENFYNENGEQYVGEMKKFLYYIIIQVVLGVILYSLFGIPFDPEENTAVCLYYAMLIVWVVGLYDTIRTTRELNMGY